ncbi:MAG: type I glutamate--ammonia ligase [Actinomycetaceae bacterium]|nr:type I glutamate--ammonia ligase [Actinomycetaceae bacterium]
MDKQQEHVLRTCAEQEIRFIRLWFTDVLGVLKSIVIAPAELERAFSEGVAFDGSSIEGFTRLYESDMLLIPDANTFQILPWSDNESARMFCDVHLPDGTQARMDPRAVLERTLQRAEKAGFTVFVHPEIEFYLLKPIEDLTEPLVPQDFGGYFDNVVRGSDSSFRRRAILMLEEMGIAVEYSHHEGGPGQNEIDLRSVDALTAADNLMTFRVVVEEAAIREGVMATFMPKPMIDAPGSGMHTHFALFEGDTNAFYDPGGLYQLSNVGRSFTAGLLAHAAEISAIVNQHVNSYKRLWGGGEAPSYICWGHNNRSALVRVPNYKPELRRSARIEYRALDPSCNPYLAFAVIIEAGLDGIEKKMELPPEAEDNVWELSDPERRALGISALPASLHSAIDLMADSELVARTLGEQVFDYVLRSKKAEWHDYRNQVTLNELQRFLRPM